MQCHNTSSALGDRLRIDTLARRIGISLRQVERRFRDAVGVGPKALCSGRPLPGSAAPLLGRRGLGGSGPRLRLLRPGAPHPGLPALRRPASPRLPRRRGRSGAPVHLARPARPLLRLSRRIFPRSARGHRSRLAARRWTMKRFASALVVVLVLAGSRDWARRGPRSQSLGWLAGSWEGSDGTGVEMEELWTAPKGGAMLGLHRDVKDGRMASFEFMRIESGPEGLAYLASPRGRPATSFPLKESAASEGRLREPQARLPAAHPLLADRRRSPPRARGGEQAAKSWARSGPGGASSRRRGEACGRVRFVFNYVAVSLRFRVLGSGSTGNATLVEGDGTRILIDAGLGPRSARGAAGVRSRRPHLPRRDLRLPRARRPRARRGGVLGEVGGAPLRIPRHLRGGGIRGGRRGRAMTRSSPARPARWER